MAQYATDFREYALNEQPSDFTQRWVARNWLVRERAGAKGGKVLESASVGSSIRAGLSWDKLDSDTEKDNFEMYFEFLFPETGQSQDIFSLFEASGTAGNETGWRAGVRNSDLNSARYTNGNFISAGSINQPKVTSRGVPSAAYVQHVSGQFKRIRTWALSSSEPTGWDISRFSNIDPVGWMGLLSVAVGAVEVDFLGVGTGSDPAPRSLISAGAPTLSKPTATSVSANSIGFKVPVTF